MYTRILEVWKLFLWDFCLECLGLFSSFSGKVRNLKQQVLDLKSNFLLLFELLCVLYSPIWMYKKKNIGQIPSRIFIMCLHMPVMMGHALLLRFITLESNTRFFSIQVDGVNLTSVTFKNKRYQRFVRTRQKEGGESLVSFMDCGLEKEGSWDH